MSNTIDAGRSYATEPASEQYVAPEYPEDREAGQLTRGPSGYAYGYGAPEGALPPFLSDGELMMWLQTKSEETYSRVRDVMGVSTERSKLMQDLTHLKGTIDSGVPLETALAEMDALNTAYAGTIYETEVSALCGLEAQNKLSLDFALAKSTGADMKLEEGLSEDIQAQIDKFGRDDQLALVQIHSLMSDIRETAQLTSNLMSSRDQASNTIVGNIRG
jgi:hypothetical protein